jgi:Uma2 family endonuclease
MSIAEVPRTMTVEEFLALPDDGVERWLIHGELRENREANMNLRSPDHGRTTINVGRVLKNWVVAQLTPRGNVYGSDTTFKIRSESSVVVGVDVAYVSPELEAQIPRGKRVKMVEGAPKLIAEVLSPSDKHSDVSERVQNFLDAGVEIVWVVDPDFQTVCVFRPSAEPQLFNRVDELSAEPQLPGFRVRVAELFE